MKKVLLLMAVCLTVASPAFAVFLNAGFEMGNLSGWDSTGNVTVTGTGTIDPIEGTKMAELNPGGILTQYSTDVTDLGHFSYAIADINALLPSLIDSYHTVRCFSVRFSGYKDGQWNYFGMRYYGDLMTNYPDGHGTWQNFDFMNEYIGFYPGGFNECIGSKNYANFMMEIAQYNNVPIYLDNFSLNDYANPNHPNTAPVPEPATLSLLGIGLLGLVSFRKK